MLCMMSLGKLGYIVSSLQSLLSFFYFLFYLNCARHLLTRDITVFINLLPSTANNKFNNCLVYSPDLC